jgi:hypothetical protein
VTVFSRESSLTILDQIKNGIKEIEKEEKDAPKNVKAKIFYQ